MRAAGFGACGRALSVSWPAAGPRFDGTRLRRRRRCAFRTGPVPPSWQRSSGRHAARVPRRRAPATVAVNGRCGVDGDDVPLASLTQHLFLSSPSASRSQAGADPRRPRGAAHRAHRQARRRAQEVRRLRAEEGRLRLRLLAHRDARRRTTPRRVRALRARLRHGVLTMTTRAPSRLAAAAAVRASGAA